MSNEYMRMWFRERDAYARKVKAIKKANAASKKIKRGHVLNRTQKTTASKNRNNSGDVSLENNWFIHPRLDLFLILTSHLLRANRETRNVVQKEKEKFFGNIGLFLLQREEFKGQTRLTT